MNPNDNQELMILNGPADMAERAVKIFMQSANEMNDHAGRFNVALSGGSTPRSMNRMLAGEPCVSEIDWGKIHLFWVDERCVPFRDSNSNYGTARKDMIDAVPLPQQQIHPMPAEMDPEEGALDYEAELVRHFGLPSGEYPEFELMVLGLGRDGHTASLFPGQPSLTEKKRLVLAVKGGNPDVYRLTLALPVINRTKKVLILVSGERKADIVRRIFQEKEAALPVQHVRPEKGKLIWLLDREAASLL